RHAEAFCPTLPHVELVPLQCGAETAGLAFDLFDPDLDWRAARTGKRGHPEMFSNQAIQACLTLKVLFRLPLRQTVGLVASLIKMAGLDWPVPDWSALCRRQARISVQIPYKRAGGPLNLLIDSTGIRFRGDGEWLARKHGATRRREWRKVHMAMDTGTGDIRAVEFTSSHEGDSALLPDLLAQIPEDEGIETVTADGACETRRCLDAILARDAEPIIPVRRNGRMWTPDCPTAIWRNETLRATQRPGPVLWNKWSGYHVRSRIEAQMNRFKLFGDRIVSRDADRQVAEIHIRISIMNR